jgi:hypothetical protein
MTLPELSACLESLGVKLSLSGDKLVVDAPANVVTPEVRTALAIHKPALLALLACGPPRARPDSPIPCSDTEASDAEARSVIAAGPTPLPERGPRDFRLGHRWLPWHFNPGGSSK